MASTSGRYGADKAETLIVEEMLSLHKQLAAAKAPHDKTVVQGQIDTSDPQIYRLVCELYGLTQEEIKIVGGANQFRWCRSSSPPAPSASPWPPCSSRS